MPRGRISKATRNRCWASWQPIALATFLRVMGDGQRAHAVPQGAHTEAFAFKVCVPGLWQDEVAWPMMWAFVAAEEAESVVGK